MNAAMIVALIFSAAALFLALRNLRSFGMTFQTKAWMALTWVTIIAVIAYVVEGMGQ